MSQELKKLIALKLEVIQFHTGTENEYIRNSMAHDACYTANNSVKYKEEIISENRGSNSKLMMKSEVEAIANG
jgi:Holliday junction resolvase RusA-like endonuclease